MTERWVRIHYELYEVSSLGRVRRVALYKTSRPGGVIRASAAANGYPRVSLSHRQRVSYRHVHVLVAESFLGPRPSGYQVNHINGVKTDNRAVNLEYVTPRENTIRGLELKRRSQWRRERR